MVEILAILMFLQILGKIVSSPVLLIGTFLVISFMVGTIKHWLMNRSLLDRQQFDDEEFGRSFYGGHKVRADLAVRVRRILSDNLEMSLDGIRPEDHLDDDLDVQLEVNPDLFWALEKEFGFNARVEELEVFEKTTSEIATFSDLVSYVERKVDELKKKGVRKKVADEIDPDDRTSDYIAALWFGGLFFFFVGETFGIHLLSAIGLTAAFSPLALGAFYLCGNMVREVISISRNEGLQMLWQHPFSTLLSLAMFSMFLLFGGWFGWGIITIWFFDR